MIKKYYFVVVEQSTSVKLIAFVIVSVILFYIGLMIGLWMNHDDIFKVLNPNFFRYFSETLGGS
ncbi:hypothetical protein [Staphylococcus muscae]|uniref:DNA-directed RNA polymerase subunit beta n=1 Tax=Staphylococcus muscae TaxID=1294 RepID=A0ABQ1HWE9_9STAP|nr:hypothetical protein [Staphylococcus muscae]PNZ05506.1 hypothetical protein CD131_02240 [Staphylococcus muscae]GGA91866.1 hypothetical protein GCM10007183_15030 [Staphylococcus muscae]